MVSPLCRESLRCRQHGLQRNDHLIRTSVRSLVHTCQGHFSQIYAVFLKKIYAGVSRPKGPETQPKPKSSSNLALRLSKVA